MRKLTLACAALVAAGVFMPSFAGEREVVSRVTVSYADLNLSRHEGAGVLLDRLDQAARRVCGDSVGGIRPLAEKMGYARCYDGAMDKAVAAIDNRLVAEMYGKPTLVAAGHDNTVVASAVELSSR